MNQQRNTKIAFSWPIIYFILSILGGCNTEPQPINFGNDACQFCKMTMMDKKFGAELINKKGKTLKFDSGECMIAYLKTDSKFVPDKIIVVNYASPGTLLDANGAFFLQGGKVNSPMGGKLAAFKTREEAESFKAALGGEIILWNRVSQISF